MGIWVGSKNEVMKTLFLCEKKYLCLIKLSKSIVATTQLNPKLGRPYFPKINHKTKTTTVRHFFSAPTQPNSTKFSMQPYFNPTRKFMQKNWVTLPLTRAFLISSFSFAFGAPFETHFTFNLSQILAHS